MRPATARLTPPPAPAPRMAAVLAWVVLTGRPARVHRSRQAPPPRSADRPSRGPRRTMSRPTASTMRRPPRAVPRAMTAAHRRVRDGSGEKPAPRPPARAAARRNTPRSFCPSWAPWRKAMAAAPAICPRRHRRAEGRACSTRRRQAAPARYPSSRESASPSRIRPQGPGRRLAQPPGRARAAPDSPAARAWLSLVGTPNRHAAAAHTTMAHRAAHRAGRAAPGDEPKSAMS